MLTLLGAGPSFREGGLPLRSRLLLGHHRNRWADHHCRQSLPHPALAQGLMVADLLEQVQGL